MPGRCGGRMWEECMSSDHVAGERSPGPGHHRVLGSWAGGTSVRCPSPPHPLLLLLFLSFLFLCRIPKLPLPSFTLMSSLANDCSKHLLSSSCVASPTPSVLPAPSSLIRTTALSENTQLPISSLQMREAWLREPRLRKAKLTSVSVSALSCPCALLGTAAPHHVWGDEARGGMIGSSLALDGLLGTSF